MKILLIANLFPSKKHPYYGTFIQKFEEGLKSAENIEINRIVITKQENTFSKFFAYVIFCARIFVHLNFFRNKWDIIYVHYLNHTLIPFLFVFNKKKMPPLILNAHGSDLFPEKKRGLLIFKLAKKIIPYATKIVVPSRYFRSEIESKFRIKAENILISSSGGIDLLKFKNKSKKSENSEFVIGFLGRIESNKGINLLMEVLPELKTQIPQIKCKVAGGGSKLNYVKAKIVEKKLTNQVQLLGPIAHEDVPDFFHEVDLFLFVSTRKGESLGLVALEALASGTPVIAYNNGAVEEYIEDGKNGFIFSEYDKKPLQKLIMKYYLLSSSEKKKYRDAALASVVRFDKKKVSSDLIAKLKQISQNIQNAV